MSEGVRILFFFDEEGVIETVYCELQDIHEGVPWSLADLHDLVA